MRRLVFALGAFGASALAIALTGSPVSAWEQACDFLTGGGWILTTASETHAEGKGTFAIGGGCKHDSPTPTWGHLEYHDHVIGLNAHWTSITAYMKEGDSE